MASTINDRKAWDDRFAEPTIVELRAALEEGPVEMFDRAREKINAIKGLTEGFHWEGPCWRWTLSYTVPGQEEPVAMVIPSPTDLQLAMPLDKKFVGTLTTQKMSRTVRDGIDMVKDPYDNEHAIWSLVTANVVDELVALVATRVDSLTGKKR